MSGTTDASSTALESVIVSQRRMMSFEKPLLRLDAGALVSGGKESFDATDLAALWGRKLPSTLLCSRA